MDLVVMILLILYLVGETHRKIYEKDVGRMFIIIAILMLLSGESNVVILCDAAQLHFEKKIV